MKKKDEAIVLAEVITAFNLAEHQRAVSFDSRMKEMGKLLYEIGQNLADIQNPISVFVSTLTLPQQVENEKILKDSPILSICESLRMIATASEIENHRREEKHKEEMEIFELQKKTLLRVINMVVPLP